MVCAASPPARAIRQLGRLVARNGGPERMRANSVYFFKCPQDKVAERIIEIAGGNEISSATHEYTGFGVVNILLVLVGNNESLRANDERVKELLP
jgi:hypothetical protein